MNEEEIINKLETIKISGDKGTIYNYEAGAILSLIEKQQAEYSDLKLKYEQGLLLHKKHISDLEIKDRMIDVMADCIAYGGKIHEGKPEKVKEYFRNKIK